MENFFGATDLSPPKRNAYYATTPRLIALMFTSTICQILLMYCIIIIFLYEFEYFD